MTAITVLLPIHEVGDSLRAAFACIQHQSFRDLEVLLILNGSDAGTRRRAADLVKSDPRARMIELPEANLAAALNRGLREARNNLVARMDADDLCTPDRLARQVAFLKEHPDLAALGCAWEQRAPDGRLIATIRPATDAAELRWRLLISNDLAHGSMLLRRAPVLAAGGYDEQHPRAQDYDLWLRLSRSASIGALPDVLYTHNLRRTDRPYSASSLQAAHAAEILTEAWSSLPSLEELGRKQLAEAMAASMSDHASAPGEHDQIAAFLTRRGPSRDGLLAWLWSRTIIPSMPAQAAETCRRARLREVGAALRAAGVARLWLWGAGSHTARLLDHRDDLGMGIAGIADHALAGQQRFGFTISHPDTIEPGQHALISSDAHEQAIWEASAPARQRGVKVHRLYST